MVRGYPTFEKVNLTLTNVSLRFASCQMRDMNAEHCVLDIDDVELRHGLTRCSQFRQ